MPSHTHMSYRYQSQQTSELRELIVAEDLIWRGFVNARMTRDHLYDILFERSHLEGQRPVFETIQVKPGEWLKYTPISTRGGVEPFAKNGRVSNTGKPRNNTLYRDFCIDWIAAVDVQTRRIWYYPWETYRHLERIQVGVTTNADIGRRDVPTHCRSQHGLWQSSEPTIFD